MVEQVLGISASDNAIIIGIIAIGVFFGVTMAYDVLDISVSGNQFIAEILAWIWMVGLFLLASGIIYKVVKWKSSR